MALTTISPIKYGRLLAKIRPKVIETREEFDRYLQKMEQLDRRAEAGKPLTAEEETLLALLEQLVKDYDDKVDFPAVPPLEALKFLMEKKGLRQADLLEVFGSRSVASDVLNGRREISKAHARRLADYFRLPADLFI